MAEEESEREYFLGAHSDFKEKLKWVVRIFNGVRLHKVEPRRAWANLLFFRIGNIGNSLLLLSGPEAVRPKRSDEDLCDLDHTSIAALARNMVEACVMFLYISDLDISDEEWLVRRLVLDLHDATTRYRMAKDIGENADAENNKANAAKLKQLISASLFFKGLYPEKQKELLKGQVLYLGGLRAAVRKAGFDVDHFNAMQAYLSSHTHSSPASFNRTSLDLPVRQRLLPDDQYRTAGLALEYATDAVGLSCERMFLLYPEVFLTGQTKH